jgi:hypothetical protein
LRTILARFVADAAGPAPTCGGCSKSTAHRHCAACGRLAVLATWSGPSVAGSGAHAVSWCVTCWRTLVACRNRRAPALQHSALTAAGVALLRGEPPRSELTPAARKWLAREQRRRQQAARWADEDADQDEWDVAAG